MRHLLLIIGWVCITPVSLWSSHIIGGDITYECLGYNASDNTNSYQIVMKIYRNCNRLSMDVFSDPAPVSIYREDASGYTRIRTIHVPLVFPIVNIPPDVSNPCLELPPDICVEEGTYIINTNLEVIDGSYHISYQRCCRNITINNIQNPNMVGATYTLEIRGEEQQSCNSGPVFNEFPPIVICANTPIDFDHSATDPEGDQLVYELCAPLLGAGIKGAFDAGDPTACDGFRPDPACPPPYLPVDYVQPTFNAQSPLIGDPGIAIDPFTGLITGIPTTLGQYVVGICVKEYRNANLLSITQRDFQFNVANCEPIVKAMIVADEVIDGQNYVIKVCGDLEATIINESVRRSNINELLWTFDIDDNLQTITSWDATLVFPDTGVYYGSLLLNPNSDCSDSLNVIVEVFPGLEAAFSYSFDSCEVSPISFVDESISGAGQIDEWRWRFDFFDSKLGQNVNYLFEEAGEHEVRLTVRDSNGCVAIAEQNIAWYPAPALVIVEPSSFTGCMPMDIVFDNLSFPVNEEYDIVWDFGDGNGSGEVSPAHTYQNTGTYSVSVAITSPIGCFASAAWEDWIQVNPLPEAAFSYSPERPNNLQPEVQFTDRSIDAVGWFWDFDGEDNSIIQHPIYVFQDTGLQRVELVAVHPLGCTDTVVQWIDVEPQIRYFYAQRLYSKWR